MKVQSETVEMTVKSETVEVKTEPVDMPMYSPSKKPVIKDEDSEDDLPLVRIFYI